MIIYKATNKINQKKYIGKTIQSLSKRKRAHKYSAINGKSETYFHRAIRKYGWDSFEWEEIDCAETYEELSKKEIHWVNHFQSFGDGYNLTEGGDGSAGAGYLQEGELNHMCTYPDDIVKLAKLLKRDTPLSNAEISSITGISKKYLWGVFSGARRANLILKEEDKLPEEYGKYLGTPTSDFGELVSIGKKFSNTNNDEYMFETLAIRDLEMPLKQLAEIFNMQLSTVSRIKNGKRRADIDKESLTVDKLIDYKFYLNQLLERGVVTDEVGI